MGPARARPRLVALFGLSADPPTGRGGHLGIVRWCAGELRVPSARGSKRRRGVDEVWVLPVYRHIYGAKREMTPYGHRLAMAHLQFDGLDTRVPVRVVEAERETYEDAVAAARTRGEDPAGVRVGTYDVVRHLEAASPGTRFVLVLGADTWADLRSGKWRHAAELSGMVDVVALPRPGVGGGNVESAPPLDDVSSSLARTTTDLEVLRRILAPKVLEYVLAHRLYAVGAAMGGSTPRT